MSGVTRVTHNPDALDVHAQVAALREDFSVETVFKTDFRAEAVVVIAQCYGVTPENAGMVCQAYVSRPLRSQVDITVMMFAAAFDCYMQLDRGSLGARTPDIPRGWDGRVQVGDMRRRRR